MPITYRLATAADAERCNNFGNTFRQQSRSIDGWNWEFLDAADGPASFVIAEDGTTIVGTQAGIPMSMWDGSAPIKSAKSEETLIHPEYRGQGIFEGMYELLFDALADRGIHLIWGFTPAVRPFARVGFEIHENVGQIYFPLHVGRGGPADSASAGAGRRAWLRGAAATALDSGSRLLRRSVGATWLRNAPQPRTGEWASINSDFVARISRQCPVVTLSRTGDYMSWRVQRNPYSTSTLFVLPSNPGPYVLVAKANNGFYQIVDLMAEPGDYATVGTLLSAAVDFAESRGAAALRLLSVRTDPLSETVSRVSRFLGGVGWPIRGRGAMVVYRGEQERQPLANWYVTSLFTEGHNG